MLILSLGAVTESVLSTFKQENLKHFLLDELKVESENEKYSHVMILSDSTRLISHEKISEIMACVEAHGKLTIKYQGEGVKISDAETEMKLCGLLSVSVRKEEDGAFEVEGIKPDLSAGAAQRRSIKSPSKDALKAFLTSEPSSASALVDDSNLLKEEDLVKPSNTAEGEECGPKAKKKACRNCSCGLKEVEEAAAAASATENKPATVIDTTNAKSSCGSVRKTIITCFINYSLVLFGRCFQMCRMSLSRFTRLYTRPTSPITN